MTAIIDAPTDTSAPPSARLIVAELHLLGRSVRLLLTSMVGVLLFSAWITVVVGAPVTIFAPLVLPVTAVVRAYADGHRREARRLTGWPMRPRYRSPETTTPVRRVWSVVRDPQSWRDAWWCLLHGIVACITSSLIVTLFVGTIFYLSYPLLYWATPPSVFGHPFGGLVDLHSVAQSTVMMPLALLSFGLWYVLTLPLTRLELSLTRALL